MSSSSSLINPANIRGLNNKIPGFVSYIHTGFLMKTLVLGLKPVFIRNVPSAQIHDVLLHEKIHPPPTDRSGEARDQQGGYQRKQETEARGSESSRRDQTKET